MPDVGEPLRRWQEPDPRPVAVVLLTGGLGCCLVVGVSSVIFLNWDLVVLVVVLGAALAADLWRDVRPRQYVVAGAGGLLVRLPRRTTMTAWGDVAGFRNQPRRFLPGRAVLLRRDGTTAALPVGVPVERLERWRTDLSPRTDG